MKNLSIKGKHNVQNSMAAATVAKILNISDQNIRESLGNFQSINHRLEHVLTIQKVKYINDSKATNVNAVYYALDSMKSSTVWIVGGVDKGNNYEDLIPLVREKVKAIICIGIDNSKIIESFSPFVDLIIENGNMIEAVKNAYKLLNQKIVFYCHQLVQVLIYSKIMKIEVINLRKLLENYNEFIFRKN